jgi:hypothetical protein
MATQDRDSATVAEIVGAAIGFFALTLFLLLSLAFVLQRAWNGSVVELFGMAGMSWRQSVCLLTVVWILAAPFRVRVAPK